MHQPGFYLPLGAGPERRPFPRQFAVEIHSYQPPAGILAGLAHDTQRVPVRLDVEKDRAETLAHGLVQLHPEQDALPGLGGAHHALVPGLPVLHRDVQRSIVLPQSDKYLPRPVMLFGPELLLPEPVGLGADIGNLVAPLRYPPEYVPGRETRVQVAQEDDPAQQSREQETCHQPPHPAGLADDDDVYDVVGGRNIAGDVGGHVPQAQGEAREQQQE